MSGRKRRYSAQAESPPEAGDEAGDLRRLRERLAELRYLRHPTPDVEPSAVRRKLTEGGRFAGLRRRERGEPGG